MTPGRKPWGFGIWGSAQWRAVLQGPFAYRKDISSVKKHRPLAPPQGELAEIFDFGQRGQKSALSVTAFAVTPLPKGEASHSLAQKRQLFDSLTFPIGEGFTSSHPLPA